MSAPTHALVTGGGTGVGRSVAERLSGQGWRVTVVGRRRAPLEETARLRPKTIGIEEADVTDELGLRAAFESAETRFGPIEAVVANAGQADSRPFHRMSLEAFRQLVDVNLTGAFLTARLALPSMLERGRGGIVFIASTAGLKGYPYVVPYCAAKHGVVGMARALALETASQGITVNAICPGFTDTPMLQATIDNIVDKTGRSRAEARAALLENNPQGRFIEPAEVAACVSWLLSDGARSVTGQAIALSGGEI